MLDVDIKLIKDFRVPSEESVNEQMYSISAMNPFIPHNSTNRGEMMTRHLSQTITLDHGEHKIVQSGVEHQLPEYTFDVRIKKDCIYRGMVERYKSHTDDEHVVEVILIVEYLDGTFDYYSIPYYFSLHQFLGFKYNMEFQLDELRRMQPGTELKEGTVLATSPSSGKDGGFKYGINANILLGSCPGQEEDGVIVSQSLADKLNYSTFEKRTIEYGSNNFILNLYGDEDNPQGFPMVGEMVGEHGILAALRKLDDESVPALMSKQDLKHHSTEFDKCVYVGPGKEIEINGEMVKSGVVVDIKCWFNSKNKGKNNAIPKTLGDTYEMAYKLRKFYNGILEIYENEIKPRAYSSNGKRNNNIRPDGSIKLSPALSNLIEEAYVISNKENKKIEYVLRRMPLDVFHLEFVIQYRCKGINGSKISDLNGGKGVIVKILPDEMMPYDKDGNRADLIMDPTSIVSRANMGRLYEIYFNSASRKAKKIITDYLAEHPNDIEGAWSFVMEFLKILDTEQYAGYKKANREEKEEILKDIVENEFYILYRIGSTKPAYEIVIELEKSKFAPPRESIFVPGRDGKVHETFNKMSIGPLYTILLGKVPDDALISASSTFLNHFGFPSRSSQAIKYMIPWKSFNIKFLSETDTRLITACCGSKGIIMLKDLANNNDTNDNIHYNLLKADKPAGMKSVVDREVSPYGGDAALKLLKSVFLPTGLDFEYVRDESNQLIPECNPRIGLKNVAKRKGKQNGNK